MAALTQQGFTVRTLQEIIDEIGGNLKANFGDTFNTDPSSPDGQLIGIFAEQIWNVEQASQAAYQCSDPDSASGVALEYVCDYNGVYRRADESDSQLRNRRAFSVVNSGTNSVESIKSDIFKLGAEHVSVVENATDAVVDTVPAKSFHTIVKGGDSNEIARKIFDNKPAGILAYGDTKIDVIDSQGYSHEIGFSRPVDTTIKVAIEFKRTGESSSNDIIQSVTETVEAYINGLKIGEDVIWSSVFGAAVIGANVFGGGASFSEVKIGTSVADQTTDITLLPQEKAYTTSADIVVTEITP